MEKAALMTYMAYFAIFVCGLVIGRITMAIQYAIMSDTASAKIVKKIK